ncbi:general stress protein 26 [Bradyrhizobium sp. GM2.2]|uniref:pyridoxamine 5'-phosphate oxidase family protein n=1 Tax=unclassified Bradyrhizobium TaxID=2631580 RepID=UPI001FF8CF83|nr:pyridoxamine 5'-phosphate oxidase family protein [Bradyrhizobium sp. 145]MCK1688980.1 pyridoxamine 5'-phosphate oxidase family protein [Bradyrhizobium sp. 145]
MPDTMPVAPTFSEAQIVQFLDAARETIAAVPVCWLATRSLEGGTSTRAVSSSAGPPQSDEWTRRFLVRKSSRKVAEMQAAPLVTLAFQHPSGERYIALGGRATIIDDVAEMRTMWSSDLDAHFPPGFADANMIIIQVDVDRIEVHVRGLTPEPWGAGRTLLERQSTGSWRFIPAW